MLADSWAELKWKHEAQWQREQRDQALSSKTTPALPTAASQLPPVKLLVCLFVCCVSLNGPSFLNQCTFRLLLFDGERGEQRTKKKRLRWEHKRWEHHLFFIFSNKRSDRRCSLTSSFISMWENSSSRYHISTFNYCSAITSAQENSRHPDMLYLSQ